MFHDQSHPTVRVDHLGWLCSAPGLMVFDVEIQDEVANTGGWDATDMMEISVAVVWVADENRYRFFNEDSREALVTLLSRASVVAGFNIWSFDLPLIYGVPRSKWMNEHMVIAPGLAERVFDPHRLARIAHGRPIDGPCGPGLGLHDIATRTLQHASRGGKSAHGSEAPAMFQRGDLLGLHQYCLDDVWLEASLVEFARRHRYIVTGQGIANITHDPLWV